MPGVPHQILIKARIGQDGYEWESDSYVWWREWMNMWFGFIPVVPSYESLAALAGQSEPFG